MEARITPDRDVTFSNFLVVLIQPSELTFEEDLRREYLDWLRRVAQMIRGRVVEHWLWVSLQNRVLLCRVFLHPFRNLKQIEDDNNSILIIK